MRDLSVAQLSALAGRHLKRRLFIWVVARDLITGLPDPIGFWDDVGNVTVGSRTYIGSGSVVKVDTIHATSDFTIPALTVTMSGLSPTVVAVVRGEVVSQASIEVSLGLFDVDTNSLVDSTLYTMFTGVIDTVEIQTPEAGGFCNVIFTCESISRALTIKSTATRSPPSSKERSSTDLFYDYTGAQRERTVYFGRRDPNSSNTKHSH